MKSLAAQTARATEENAARIDDIQTITGGSVGAIRAISLTTCEIRTIATSIAAAVC